MSRSAPRRRAAPAPVLVLGLGLGLGGAAPAPAGELTTFDLLVLYTPGAAARYGGDAATRIHHVVSVSNQILEDSGVFARLRVVHTEQVDYGDSASSSRALDDLSFEGTSLHATATSLRDAHGADFVTLMRPYAGDGTCGIAWVGGYRRGGSFSAWDVEHAFSHVSIDCSDSVLAHELGHNMGLSHSRRQDPEGGTFPWSVGHGEDGLFTTVMAYESSFGAPKIHKHSSPALDCLGRPCGVPREDADDGADAAHSLNAVRATLAAYRDAVTPEPSAPPATPDPAPTDPGDPPDPGDVVGGDAEVRVEAPAPRKRRTRVGRTLELAWSSAGVDHVDVAYRSSRREGRERVADAGWTPIATGVGEGPIAWTVPELGGRRVRLQLRVVGRDAAGAEVASHATRELRVRRAPRR